MTTSVFVAPPLCQVQVSSLLLISVNVFLNRQLEFAHSRPTASR